MHVQRALVLQGTGKVVPVSAGGVVSGVVSGVSGTVSCITCCCVVVVVWT